MATYWSASTKGFYIDGVGAPPPPDAVEIPDELRLSLLKHERAAGPNRIESDADGRPVVGVKPQTDRAKNFLNVRRAKNALMRIENELELLADNDPAASASVGEWRQYRKDLRAWLRDPVGTPPVGPGGA